MKSHMRHVATTSLVLGALAIGAGIFVWSGLYDIGADEPHWMPTRTVLAKLRDRSIEARMADVRVPDLDDPGMIAAGAVNYSTMCTGCHLAPGVEETEIRTGLYPAPPDLTRLGSGDPKRTFWIIKHGIKMSAMPAWGKTHTDAQIWNMTAFIRRLPGMTADQYAALGGKPPAEDADHMHAGEHAETGPAQTPAHEHGHDQAHAHGDDSHAAAALAGEGLRPNAEPGAEAAARAFHAALEKGDGKAALALLAPEVTISEDGETRSRAQYAALHLGEDIAFLKSARIKPLAMGSMPMGRTAMVGSRSEIRTLHDGQPVALLSKENLTLREAPTGWLITAIEWTSDRLPD